MADKKVEKSYEEWKDEAIRAFRKVPKSSVAFDYARIPKEVRIKLLKDDEYNEITRQVLATQYVKDLEKLDDVLEGRYGIDTKDSSGTVLKTIAMKQEILYRSLGVEADDSNAINIVFVEMSKEEFSSLEQVEVNETENNAIDVTSVIENAGDE